MISTNYVFPRIIKASEEKALIWDQTYWKLFSLYLAYFTDLNAIQKKIIVYEDCQPQGTCCTGRFSVIGCDMRCRIRIS